MQLFLKILSRMANSGDPDQTAPEGAVWSGSALFAYVILPDTLVFEILGHLPYLIFAPKHTFRYSTEVHLQGISNEYPHIFWTKITKKLKKKKKKNLTDGFIKNMTISSMLIHLFQPKTSCYLNLLNISSTFRGTYILTKITTTLYQWKFSCSNKM